MELREAGHGSWARLLFDLNVLEIADEAEDAARKAASRRNATEHQIAAAAARALENPRRRRARASRAGRPVRPRRPVEYVLDSNGVPVAFRYADEGVVN